MLQPDLNSVSASATEKNSAAIQNLEDVFRSRYIFDHYLCKSFAKAFANDRISDPQDRIKDAQRIAKLQRWLDAHGCAAISNS